MLTTNIYFTRANSVSCPLMVGLCPTGRIFHRKQRSQKAQKKPKRTTSSLWPIADFPGLALY